MEASNTSVQILISETLCLFSPNIVEGAEKKEKQLTKLREIVIQLKVFIIQKIMMYI